MFLDCININYRNSIESSLSDIDIEVNTYLENMGYSMELKGTEFFREMIVSIVEKVLNFSEMNGEEMQQLLESIRMPYSQFYFDLSRNRHDIGITSYNEYIRKAISLNENETTGLRAYQIAQEILLNRGIETNIVPFVRKLEQ